MSMTSSQDVCFIVCVRCCLGSAALQRYVKAGVVSQDLVAKATSKNSEKKSRDTKPMTASAMADRFSTRAESESILQTND